jgi:hypothetical protein
MSKYDPQYIDQEEKEIMESIKTMDVTKLQKPSEMEQKKLRAAAKGFIKDTKMKMKAQAEFVAA